MIPSPYPSVFPKAILFDWDSTLVDTCEITFKALNASFRSVGLDALRWEDFLSRPSLAMRVCLKDILSEEEALHAENVFYQTVAEQHLSSLKPLEGVEDLLRWLAEHTIYKAVVSNKKGDILRKEVSHLGWDHHFHRIIGSYDTEEDKPSPVPLLHALKEHAPGPGHDVWFVGDSIVDIECAVRAGCVAVAVGPQAELHEAPMIKAKNCFGLHQLLLSLADTEPSKKKDANKT